MEIIAIIIAVAGAAISIATFYFTHLQAPKLLSLSGPFIKVYYADYASSGSFGLYLPVTFMNKSAKTGIIINTAIRLYKEDLADQSYFMQWREFSKLDIKEKAWVFEEIAHAIAVPGKSSVNKVIWFMWEWYSQPKLVLQKGTYKIDLYFWEQPEKPPHCETHGFVIDDSIYEKLEKFRSEQKLTTVDIRLDKQINQNRLMTYNEVKKIF